MKKLFLLILTAVLSVSLFSCGDKKDYNVKNIDGYIVEESKAPTNYVRIVMESGDAMLVELYPDDAPITVANFKKLVAEKYYDGIVFHRIEPGFVIQGGDPDGDGISNGDRPNIKGEFYINGVRNTIKHERGVLSMARNAYNYNSASTQFFIVHQTTMDNSNSLDGQYAAFGKLLAGYGTLDKIAATNTQKDGSPKMAEVRFVNIVSTPDAK